MKYLIIHQDQVGNKLETKVFNNVLEAKAKQYDLRQQYHDVVLISEQELLELKLKVNHGNKTI